LFAGFLVITLFSCEKKLSAPPCNVDFKLIGYSNTIFERSNTSYSSQVQRIAINDTVEYSKLMIYVDAIIQPIENVQCDPIENILTNIKNITIQCKQNYNDNFSENDTLNSIVLVRYYEGAGGELTLEPINLTELLESTQRCMKYYDFYLNEPPSLSGYYSFVISFTDNENNQYITETYPVFINL